MNILSPINLNEVTDMDSCPICFDNMNNPREIYTIENCNHRFHTKCVLEMFIQGFTDTCPMCRSIISTSNSRFQDFEDFKFKLLLKHSAKPNANILIKNMVKKYKNNELKIRELRRKQVLIGKDRKLLDKNTGVLKKLRQAKIKTGLFKNAKQVKLKLRKSIRLPKDIKELVKKCNLEIKYTIKENIDTLKNEIKELENSDAYKKYQEINKQYYNIRRNISKHNSISWKIKESILSIPFAPNV